MDNITRVNRPQSAGVSPRPSEQRPASQPTKKASRLRKPLLIAAIVLAVVLMAAGAWYLLSSRGTAAGTIDSGKYQAVFFTNGQVYFGKLTAVNDDYMRLKGVYYLQNKKQADETSPQSTSSQNSSDVELIKLGNEIHGPEDEMVVNKDQILFFENLKPAGTVSQTISNFQKNKK